MSDAPEELPDEALFYAEGYEWIRADFYRKLEARAELHAERQRADLVLTGTKAQKRIEQLEREKDATQLYLVHADGAHALISRCAELEQERDEARERRKRDCVAFFRWFWNQPGTNAEQGYDDWLRETNDE